MATLNMLHCPKSYGRNWRKSLRTERSKMAFANIAESGNNKNGYSSSSFGKIERSGNSSAFAKVSEGGKNNDEISVPLLKFIFEQARALESLNSPPDTDNRIGVNQSCIGSQEVTNSLHQKVNRTGKYRTSGPFLNPSTKNSIDEHGGLLPELGKDLQSESLLCRRIEDDLCKRLQISPSSEIKDGEFCFKPNRRKGYRKCKRTDDQLADSLDHGCEYGCFSPLPELESKSFNKCLYQSPNPRCSHSGNLNFVRLVICERCGAANQHLNLSNGVELPNRLGPLPDQGSVVDPSLNPRCGNLYSDPLVICERCGAANQRLNSSNGVEFRNRLSPLPDQGSIVDANQQKISPPVVGRDCDTTQLADKSIDVGIKWDLYKRANNQSNPKNQSDPLHHQGRKYGSYNPLLEQESKNFDKYSLPNPSCESGGDLYYDPLFFCATCDATNQNLKDASLKEFLNKLLSPLPDRGNEGGAMQQNYLLPDARDNIQLPDQLLDIEINCDFSQLADSRWESRFFFPLSNPKYEYGLHSLLNFPSAQDSVDLDVNNNIFNPLLKQVFEKGTAEI